MARYEKQCTAKGSFGYANYFKLYVELTDTEGNPDTNKSKVKYKVYCQSSGSGSINSSHLKYFKLNGQEIINKTEDINVKSPNAYINIAEGTKEIEHNNDGTKTISFEAKIEGISFGVSAQLGDNFTLTTIPRASSVGATSAYIEENTIININRANNNFTHTLTYSFHNLTGTIAEKTSKTSINFKLPTSFYAQIPNQKSSWGTIYCDTYNGNTKIGTKRCTFTVNTNEEKCKPTLTVTVVDTNNSTIALTGNANKLIKYCSNAKISITCGSKNSATISKKQVNDKVFEGSNITLEKVETGTFKVTVTDSRGYSTSKEINLEMINYVPLSMNATIKRTQPTTGEVDFSFTGNYFNGSFGSTENSLYICVYYKEQNTGSFKALDTISAVINKNNTYSNGSNKISLGKIFDYQKSYEFKIEVMDLLTELNIKCIVSQGIPIFNWKKDYFNVNGKILVNKSNILELIFPIGSTYITQTNINPSTILGFGTWERLKGKVCLGLDENDTDFNTIKKTGGEKTHKLTIDEMPKHKPKINYSSSPGGDGTGYVYGSNEGNNDAMVHEVGGDKEHNNMQPYEVVGYMWIRRS